MGIDRRDTTLGFKVEDGDLQSLAALLGTISTLLANMPSGPGQATYNAPTRPGQSSTQPATPNYGAPTGVAANVSAGGRPNPAALGGAPIFGGPSGGSALGGTAGASAFQISGAVTLQISGQLTIHAAGAITIVGAAAGGGGAAGAGAAPGAANAAPGTGGGQTPPAPQTPVNNGSPPAQPGQPPPNQSFGGFVLGGRVGLGAMLGNPRQFLQGPQALEAAGQFYVGQQVGQFAMSTLAPAMNEAQMMNAGLGRVTREDIEAGRWRGYTRTAGTVIGGVIGGVASMGNPMAIGAGMAIGGTALGFAGDYEADRIERAKAVRLSSETVEGAFGDAPGTLRRSLPRPRIRGNAQLSLWEQFAQAFAIGGDVRDTGGTGKFGDTTLVETSEILSGIAPGGLRNAATMARMNALSGRLGANYKDVTNGYLSGILRDPILAQQVQGLNSGDTSALSGGSAEFLAATGNLPGALMGARIAGGGGQAVVDTYGRLIRRRAIDADVSSGLGLVRSEVSVLRETQGSAAAARRLGSPDYQRSLGILADNAADAAREFEARAARATTEPERIANVDEARKARERENAARQQIATTPYDVAALNFAQSSAILGSRGEQAQLRLGRQLRTSLFDEGTSGKLFDAVRDNLKDQLEASFTELRAMKQAHAPAEKLAPIYSAIAKIEDDLDRQILERFEKKWGDLALPGRAAVSIGGARIGGISGTGGIYGGEMESAFGVQRAGASALLQVAQSKYAAAVQQFGANSPQAIAASVEVEQARASVAVLPFEQISQKYSGVGQLAGATGNLYSGSRQLVLGEGRGSLAAMPSTLGQIANAAQQEAIARARLVEDQRAGAGPLISASDRNAIMQAQINRQQTSLGATEVQMPAAYDIEQLKARNKLQRLESSWTEPGNMLDQYKTLYGGAEKRLRAIDAHEQKLRDAGVDITPAMSARLERQREDARQEMFGYRVRMEDGWIDRLVSYSQGGPSFAARAKPTMAQAAAELEYGQSDEHFRQARAFGFSRRGYEYERARGFSTAGKGAMELFPGDLAQMALYGKKNGKQSVPSGSSDPSSDYDPSAGLLGDGGSQDVVDALAQQTAILTQILQALQHGGGAASHGTGPTPYGNVGFTAIVKALDYGAGDNQRPRR